LIVQLRKCWMVCDTPPGAHGVNYLRLASAAQFCSTVTPASASAACQAGIPSTISKPAVVLLATKYACPQAARSAVSISSGVVSGVCRQHFGYYGGDGADIAGAVGKQHGVTVLEGKRHGGEDSTARTTAGSPSNYGPRAEQIRGPYACLPQEWGPGSAGEWPGNQNPRQGCCYLSIPSGSCSGAPMICVLVPEARLFFSTSEEP
jgi:hypothetical protein